MGFFSYINKNKWINYTLLFILGAGFILSQAQGIIHYFTNPSPVQFNLGTIAGKKISRVKYQEAFYLHKQKIAQQGYKKIYIAPMAHMYAWSDFKTKHLYTKAYKLLGLEVSQEERNSILEEGKDIPNINENPAFKDEQGNFDKTKWLEWLIKNTEREKFIESIGEDIQRNRLKQKLNYLVQATLHTTKLEGAQYPGSRKINISYLYIPYTSSTQEVDVTNEEKKAYLKKHAKAYQIKESRTIEFIFLPIIPSKEDQKIFKEALQELAINFEQAEDVEIFAKTHTENIQNVNFNWTKSTMPPLLATQLQALEQGKVIGPIIEHDGSYALYKMISCKNNRWRKGKNYKVAKIQKQCKTSEYTSHELFKKAQEFKKIKNLSQWKEKAKKNGFQTHSETFKKEDLAERLGTKNVFRDIQRWLFNPETKINSISDPIEDNNNSYVVCIMKRERTEGTALLQEVSHKIEAKIRQKNSEEQITNKLKPLVEKGKSLQKIAKAYGQDAKVYKLKNLTFEQDTLPHAGFSPKAIGSSFALEKREKTSIIADTSGIFIIQRMPDHAETFANILLISDLQKKINKEEKKEILRDLYRYFLKKGKVEDNRHLYF